VKTFTFLLCSHFSKNIYFLHTHPTLILNQLEDETKTDGGKVVTRLIIRIVVPLFQLSHALKNEKKQVINEVSEALKKAVSDGHFAKEAKAFRKGKVYKY
jgi:hypothetical protein